MVIRHRLSHQQGWTLMSNGKGLMPTKKWLFHSFSLCQLWFLAMLISTRICNAEDTKGVVVFKQDYILLLLSFTWQGNHASWNRTFIYELKLFDFHQAFTISHHTFLLCFLHRCWKTTLDVCVMSEPVNELAVYCWGVTYFDFTKPQEIIYMAWESISFDRFKTTNSVGK